MLMLLLLFLLLALPLVLLLFLFRASLFLFVLFDLGEDARGEGLLGGLLPRSGLGHHLGFLLSKLGVRGFMGFD